MGAQLGIVYRGDSMINITCQCGKTLKAKPEDAGGKGRCPDCGEVYVIPIPFLSDEETAAMKQLCQQAAALRRDWRTVGSVDKAEAAFRQLIDQYGHYWAGHYGLANTLFCQFNMNKKEPDYKKISEALASLKKAIKLSGAQREPLLELARRTSATDIKEGERLYQKAMRAPDAQQEPLFPQDWQGVHHFRFAAAAAEAGLNALAIDAFVRSIQLDPGHFKVQGPTQLKAFSCWKLALKKLGVPEPPKPANPAG